MNTKICNLIFLFISIFLIFNTIPKTIQMNLVGGILQDKLVFYPVFVGMIYTLYCQYKYKNVLMNFDKFFKFVVIYITVVLISLLVGLYTYPYYDLVISGPVTQIEKMPIVIKFLSSLGIDADINALTVLWMIARAIKGVLFEVVYAFGGAYMIYCWYYDDWRTAFKILIKGVLVSLIVVFSYSVIEVFYLAGNETAKDILVKITPYFHDINNPASSQGTWPPVLWYDLQLRSIFAEPSYFGIFAGFSIPFLWYCINDRKNSIFYSIIFTIMSFLLFLTQARTAIALLFAEMTLLFIALVYFRQKLLLKTVFLVYLSVSIAFFSSNYFINNYIDNVPKDSRQNVGITNIKVSAYLDKNFNSIFTANQRSNSARYAYIKSAFRVGVDYPILGVGKGLTAAYLVDYFTDDENKVGEVKRRIQRQNEVGILAASIPILCEYIQRFAETGIVGSIVYFLPLLFLLRWLFKKFKTLQYEYLFYSISIIGMLASAISLDLTGTYYYWVLLGLGYAICFGKENQERKL